MSASTQAGRVRTGGLRSSRLPASAAAPELDAGATDARPPGRAGRTPTCSGSDDGQTTVPEDRGGATAWDVDRAIETRRVGARGGDGLDTDPRLAAPWLEETVRVTEACTACGACLVTCPERALRRAPKRPLVVDAACTGCWACIEICPAGAIVAVPATPMGATPPAEEAFAVVKATPAEPAAPARLIPGPARRGTA